MKQYITTLLAISLLFSCSKDDSTNSDIDESDVNMGQESEIEEDDVNNEDPVDDDVVEEGDDVNNEEDPVNDDGVGEEVDNEGGDSDNSNNTAELTTEQEILVDEFIYRAFKKSRSSPNDYIRKWNSDLKIILTGQFTSEEKEILNNFFDEVKTINDTFTLNISESITDYNAEIYYSTTEEYIDDRPNYISGFSPEGVFASIPSTSNVSFDVGSQLIYSGKIWVKNPNSSFEYVIKNEILTVLGLGSTEDNTSILSSNTSITTLNEGDIFAIKALHNPLIEAGFDENEVISVIENNIDSFF